MSVLVQRPHQVSGLVSLPRQHATPSPRRPQAPRAVHQSATVQAAVLSPRVLRRQRGHSSTPQDTPAANTRSSKRRSNNTQPIVVVKPSSDSVNTSLTPASVSIFPAAPASSGNFPLSSALAIVPASQSPVLSASIPSTTTPNIPATTHSFPRKANVNSRSAPNTPNPRHSLPVPANRRRARSPRPTAKLPGLPVDEDSNDEAITGTETTPVAKRGRRNNAPGSIPLPLTGSPSSPATWQQAALLKTPGGHIATPVAPLLDAINVVATIKGGSVPASPVRTSPPTSTAFPTPANLTHSPTMPNFPSSVRRPTHGRAPSVPAFPLDDLFSSAMTLESPSAREVGHTRGQSVSSSLPPVSSLHARMMAAAATSGSGRRERTLTGNNSPGKFAGASFQHAPDAMVLPKPMMSGRFGMLGSSSSDDSSSSSGEEQVVDLGVDSADEDEVAFFN